MHEHEPASPLWDWALPTLPPAEIVYSILAIDWQAMARTADHIDIAGEGMMFQKPKSPDMTQLAGAALLNAVGGQQSEHVE